VFNKKILNLFISVHLTYEGMRIRVQVLRRAFQILWRENGSLRRNLMEARRENRRLSNLMFNFEFWCFDTVSITVLLKYKTRSLRGRGVLSEIRSKTSSLFTRNLKKIWAVGYYKYNYSIPILALHIGSIQWKPLTVWLNVIRNGFGQNSLLQIVA
jgi:hypothetical protein